MPVFHANDDEATITEVHVKSGDEVHKGDILFVVEDSKAVNEITAKADGVILSECRPYDVKKQGSVLAIRFDSVEEMNRWKAENRNSEVKDDGGSINATKKAKEMAGRLGIDLKFIADRNEGRVIRTEDVKRYHDSSEPYHNIDLPFMLKRERIIIIGAGKGAEVIVDILLDDPDKEIVGLVDDKVKIFANYSFPVLDCNIKTFPDSIDRNSYDAVIISIGADLRSMRLRGEIYNNYSIRGLKFTNAIARSAEIRRGVTLGDGNIIGSECYIGSLTRIGNNNTISYGAYIGHHNIIGDSNLIGPGTVTSGSDNIGSNCIIPAGVSMINRASIGDNVVLPVGYAIDKTIGSDTIIKEKSKS